VETSPQITSHQKKTVEALPHLEVLLKPVVSLRNQLQPIAQEDVDLCAEADDVRWAYIPALWGQTHCASNTEHITLC